MFHLEQINNITYIITDGNYPFGYLYKKKDWEIELTKIVSVTEYIDIFNTVTDKIQYNRYMDKHGTKLIDKGE